MEEKELKEYYSMITETWKFLKEFLPEVLVIKDCESNEKLWDKIMNTAGAIGKRFNDHEFITRLMVLSCEEINRVQLNQGEINAIT